MEKQEIDMTHTFLADQSYIMTSDEIEDDADALAAENTDDSGHEDHKLGVPLREQDRFLPIANVAKIMKRAIPETGKVTSTNKIAKDARECVQECVSEFISFITSEASERCHTEKRKTINGEDILYAMQALGFDNYVEPLKLYLQKFRGASKTDKNPQSPEMTYEEIEPFNQTITGTLMPDSANGETVIYTYQDNLHQFQLG